MPAGVATKAIIVGTQEKVCDCLEMRIETWAEDERTGKMRKMVRYLPPNPLHDCEYVRRRNELIPLAEAFAQEAGAEGRAAAYMAEMDRLVVQHGLVVKF